MSIEQRYLEVIKKAEILGKVLNVYGDSENPLFKARDIADWIEINNAAEMVNKLEEGSEKVIDTIDTLGGTQRTWLLTEDGVYEVLMTSRKKIAKEIRKGLKEFLKAWRKGEVKVVQKEMSELDMIISMANMQKDIKSRVETLEDKLENQMTIDYSKQRLLQNAIGKKVYERAETFMQKDKKVISKLFSSIYKEVKNKFGVTSYKDVKVSEFESAINFINSWREDQKVRADIYETE